MSTDMTNLPGNIDELKALVLHHATNEERLASKLKVSQAELEDSQTELKDSETELKISQTKLDTFQEEIDFLREHLRLLAHRRFGSSSEKSSANQLGLFNEAEEALASEIEALVEEDESENIEVPAHARKKPGRRPLPSWLEREEILHELSDEEKVCAEDGHALKEIGRESSEQLEFIPAKARVLRHVRVKYACPQCIPILEY